MNRRTFLRNGGSFALIPSAIAGFGERQPGPDSGQGGATFDPRTHGAKGDGHSNDNRAIQRAIDECAHAGGGTVNLSPGTYLTGTIVLKSNIDFHLEAGATLLGSTRIEDYAETAAANDKRSYHLIHARGADNLSITGQGTVNGQGPSFWVPTNRPQPAAEDLWKDVVTKDWKPLTRPSPMIDLAECRNLAVRDITM